MARNFLCAQVISDIGTLGVVIMPAHTLSLIFAALGVFTLVAAPGCSLSDGRAYESEPQGRVYYFDGAGGGGVLTNWGGGVREGLGRAGVPGGFESFAWHTGLGVFADQGASVMYKRQKAGEAAVLMRRFIESHPGRPVHVVGLSAGTAVAVFALEALPSELAVDEVVLLGSSLSSHYDLSPALEHVRGSVTVFTSEKDAVLGVAVSVAGTADREFCGACAAGLKGFHLPAKADQSTRELYARVHNIAWMPEFAGAGNFGGHTDAVNPAFVSTYVAPILLGTGPRFSQSGRQPVSKL